MRKIAFALIYIICVTCVAAPADYASLKIRADRFFNNNEWASAAAYYTFMLEERPEIADTYGRAIVSCMMGGDTIRPHKLLTDAMAHKVPLDSILSNVRYYAFAKDSADFYPRFLISTARKEPWLARPIDASLLKYYEQRNDGSMITKYARIMLAGMPDSPRFLFSLARGYMLTGDYSKAVETWQRILQSDPDNYDALLQLGAYYKADGNLSAAIPFFERAYSIRHTPYVESILKSKGFAGE